MKIQTLWLSGYIFLPCLGSELTYLVTEVVQDLYKPFFVIKTAREMGTPGIVCCFHYFSARTMIPFKVG